MFSFHFLIPLLFSLIIIIPYIHPPIILHIGSFVLQMINSGQEPSLENIRQSLPLVNPDRHFSLDLIPSLREKVAVVTGGNSGVGLESARQMAERGAVVVIGCRSVEKGMEAVRKIRGERDPLEIKVEFIPLDLSNFTSIKNFATTITQKYKKLDILMNNAGKLCDGPNTTEGFEPCIGIHLLGHAYLTFLLLPSLNRPSRIVYLSSSSHYETYPIGIDFGKFHYPENERMSYGQSKLAIILFTRELHLELQRIGVKDIFVNSAHPGFVATDLHGFFIFFKIWPLSQICYNLVDGALTQLYLATATEIEENSISGHYFYPIAIQGVYGQHTSKFTLNDTLREVLWKWTIETINHIDKDVDWNILKERLVKI